MNKYIHHNKILHFLSLFFVLLFFCSSVLQFFPAQAAATAKILPAHQVGEILVKLKDSTQIYKFKFNTEQELNNLLIFYNSNPSVEYAEPNYIYRAVLEPMDTYYTQQTYLSQIKANQAWDITTGSSQVTIAIIDSGVDINHPDLKNNIWTNPDEVPNNGLDDDENGFTDDIHGWDFVSNTNDPLPKLDGLHTKLATSHGTVVSGIASAQGGNLQGIAGVTWSAKIMALRGLNSEGLGSTDVVAKAIDYAIKKGAQIINLSFVGQGRSQTFEDAIKRAYDAGVLVVAAAGNDVTAGVDMDLEANKMYPVCYSGPNGDNWVLGVASVDDQNKLGSFSNFGSSCVDIVAPGVRLLSSVFHSDTDSNYKDYYQTGWTGTSVSAPQVVGVAALVKSLKPTLTLKQVQDLILKNTTNINAQNLAHQNKLGSGLLNAYQAIAATLSEEPGETLKKNQIVTAAGMTGGPHVKIFTKDYQENEFFAFDSKYRNGLSIASGDVDGDGAAEVAVGLGKNTYPWVKIFSQEGNLEHQFMAYAENFRGGVEVAVGDVDGDGNEEIVTAAGKGGGPHVRIFNFKGELEGQFFALDKNFRGGLEVAVGDVNGDKKSEIIVVPQSNLEPQVKIFNLNGDLLSSFLVDKSNMRKGLHIASGDINGDKTDDIIIGAMQGNSPYVKIFDFWGNIESEFLAFSEKFKGGVWVASGDTDGDGTDEVITGAGIGGGPQVRVFDRLGGLKFQFFAYQEKFRGGVRVASE